MEVVYSSEITGSHISEHTLNTILLNTDRENLKMYTEIVE